MFIRTILPAVFFFSASAVVPGCAFAGSGSASLRASSSSTAASASTVNEHHDDYCDESFPLAPPPPARRQSSRIGSNSGADNEHQKRRLVAIPPAEDRSTGEYYQTGEYYAPLCSDGQRIDLRKLIRCVNDQCFDEDIGVSLPFFETITCVTRVYYAHISSFTSHILCVNVAALHLRLLLE